jgi:hypothetical protein
VIPKRVVLAVSAGSVAAMLWPATAAAQYRPGPPPRTTVHVGVGVGPGYYRPYPYYGYWGPYSPFYFGFGYGWGPWYASPWYAGPWGYPYGAFAYPAPYYYPNYASARIEVKPNAAHVYLDGYLVGEVDQFDGVFQRLDLPTGEHEISVYQPGYKTFRQKTLFRPGQGYHFKATLEPLPAGAPEEGPPAPDPNRPDPYREARDPYRNAPPREPYYPPQDQNPPYPGDQNAPRDPGRTRPLPERSADRRAPASTDFGTLNVRVQPADAVITIDGERWDSPEGGSRLIVQLAAGEHRIEVKKEGFKTYTSTVQIRPGENQTVNVSLLAVGSRQ